LSLCMKSAVWNCKSSPLTSLFLGMVILAFWSSLNELLAGIQSSSSWSLNSSISFYFFEAHSCILFCSSTDSSYFLCLWIDSSMRFMSCSSFPMRLVSSSLNDIFGLISSKSLNSSSSLRDRSILLSLYSSSSSRMHCNGISSAFRNISAVLSSLCLSMASVSSADSLALSVI